ncbi:hypothetical protein IWQ51_006623 [Labrenzia sp. EL_142]|nr:hypothetical protein [Labrenzia sp. EL_142]
MNVQTNITRPNNSPAPGKSRFKKAFDATRRVFLKTSAIGVVAVSSTAIGVGAAAVTGANEEESLEGGTVMCMRRDTKFTGPGIYEVDAWPFDNLCLIERAPHMDTKFDGRFFRLKTAIGCRLLGYLTDKVFDDYVLNKVSSLEDAT